MDATIAVRSRLLDELDASVADAEAWLSNLLSTLGWTKHHLLQEDEELLPCPVDPGHRMPEEALEKHMEYCPKVAKGYTKEELIREEKRTSIPFYEKASSVISLLIDERTHKKVMDRVASQDPSRAGAAEKEMPMTLERAMSGMEPKEREALYEYIVEKTREINPHPSVSEEELLMMIDMKTREEKEKAKSYMERVAEERDHKRRRQTYRAKNVHITRKSYTDIMREVITNQTETLSQKWQDADQNINEESQGSDEGRQAGRDSGDTRHKESDDRRHRERERSRERDRHGSRDTKRERDRSDGKGRSDRDRDRNRGRSDDRSSERKDRDYKRDRDSRNEERRGSNRDHRREGSEERDSKRHKSRY